MPRPQPAVLFHRIGHYVGVALIGLGLLAIAIGWYGASGTGGQVNGQTVVSAQLPYLISGGALGLALVILGVGVLGVHAVRSSRDRIEAALLALADASPLPAGAGGTPLPADAGGLVVAGTASYHDVSCRLVPGRGETTYLTPVEAMDRGLRPCRMCKPDLPAGVERAAAAR